MRHTFQCQMRWAELDVFGHINNAVLVAYLDQARVDWGYRGLHEAEFSLLEGVAVRSLEVQFLAPMRYEATGILIDLWVTGMGTTSFVLEYEVRMLNRVFATARSAMVLIDPQTQSKRPLGVAERGWLSKFLETG